jgi:S-adenosyl-L-methionine hydrolase (adenosine-forming)
MFSVITLITDFGQRDWYAGSLKGALLKAAPTAQLIDISHEVRPFDIVQAALLTRNVWREFPEGTIHIIAVNCVYENNYSFVAVRHAGHYFLAPNNGVLTLILGNLPLSDIRYLPVDNFIHFAVKSAFSNAVAYWFADKAWDNLGLPAVEPLLERIDFQPTVRENMIRGAIVHIDHFENVVSNITREVFEKTSNGRSFSLYFKRNDPITTLSHNYCDVPAGEVLCLFNCAGLLEIAVNFGSAATLLSLKQDDLIEIVFE